MSACMYEVQDGGERVGMCLEGSWDCESWGPSILNAKQFDAGSSEKCRDCVDGRKTVSEKAVTDPVNTGLHLSQNITDGASIAARTIENVKEKWPEGKGTAGLRQ